MKKKNRRAKGLQSTIGSFQDLAAGMTFEQFYVQHRNDFIKFGKGYGLSEDDILDAYQDAVIIFYEQFSSGKLQSLKASPKTYLFSIGKHKMIDKIRDKTRREKLMAQQETATFDRTILDDLILSNRQKLLKEALETLGERCRELLILFYYQRFSISAIKEKMGYNTENVVKANKSRCMKQLRAIAQTKDIR